MYADTRLRTFDEMAGQRDVVQSMRRMTVKRSLPFNAYRTAARTAAPIGTKKTTLARIFVKAINYEHPDKVLYVCLADHANTPLVDW